MKTTYYVSILLFLIPFLSFAQENQNLKEEEILLFQILEKNLPENPERRQQVLDSLKKQNSVFFYSANGPDDLKEISEISPEGEYILIRKLAFLEGIKSIHHLQGKLAGYHKMDNMYEDLEKIEDKRRQIFDSIISYEQDRAELFRKANEELGTRITELDSVFIETNKTTKEIITKRRRGGLGIGFVGAALGVATGILIGLIGN